MALKIQEGDLIQLKPILALKDMGDGFYSVKWLHGGREGNMVHIDMIEKVLPRPLQAGDLVKSEHGDRVPERIIAVDNGWAWVQSCDKARWNNLTLVAELVRYIEPDETAAPRPEMKPFQPEDPPSE